MLPKERAMALAGPALETLIADPQDRQRILDGSHPKIKVRIVQLCRLWAGMGSIYKVSLEDPPNVVAEFVVKHVTPPPPDQQDFGDRRKAKSYQVEANFYQHVAKELLTKVKLPTPFTVEYGPKPDEITIGMSYLQGSWIQSDSKRDIQGTLKWLAHFHAAYWGETVVNELVSRVGLQEMASYWHLETRPDEHAGMSPRGLQGRLKRAARAIDLCLKRDPMQCLIHGDPKEANVMKLSSSSNDDGSIIIAMYDFQYCGKGTPTRDLAYFLCSSCHERWEVEMVEYYHEQLSEQLTRQGLTPPTLLHFNQSLQLAFCDFYRFLCGWGQWGYDLQDKVHDLLHKIDGGKELSSEAAYEEAVQQHFW